MDKSNIADRMKRYENTYRIYLEKKKPVIIRIDGKAFHSFTKGLNKPFDDNLIKCMQETMKHLCENIQGCVFGYCQSDEISLLLVDYQNLETSAWFDNNLIKIVSVSASMATRYFNSAFNSKITEIYFNVNGTESYNYKKIIADKNGCATFDSRAFNLEKDEVCNYFIWRQLDAIRNSIQAVGQANFSHKELQGKKCEDIKSMLKERKNIVWDSLDAVYKLGSCCIKTGDGWKLDDEIPSFVKDKEYIDKNVYLGEIG